MEALTESDRLDGGEVLSGFLLPLRDLVGELDRRRLTAPFFSPL
jgi:hypothetical protein